MFKRYIAVTRSGLEVPYFFDGSGEPETDSVFSNYIDVTDDTKIHFLTFDRVLRGAGYGELEIKFILSVLNKYNMFLSVDRGYPLDY